MLNKLFGGSKKEGFFLDLSDNQSPTTPAPSASAAAPAPIAPPEPVAPDPVVEAPAAPVAVASVTPEAPAAPPATPEPVSANFATTYVRASGSGAPRRRPSANMSGFMDMARSVRG